MGKDLFFTLKFTSADYKHMAKRLRLHQDSLRKARMEEKRKKLLLRDVHVICNIIFRAERRAANCTEVDR